MFESHRHGCRFLEFTSHGNRFLTMENDLIKLTFWLNKGADLIELRNKSKDMDVLWRNPAMIPAAGTYVSPANPPSGHFFDYYPGGWQEVFPNAHSATNEYKNAPLGLHGEACLLPWDYSVLTHTEQCLSIQLNVRKTVRTPFRLEKKVKINKGSLSFIIEEKITNESNEDMHYSWGQHPVFGAPFIRKDCVIDIANPISVVIPQSNAIYRRYKSSEVNDWPYLETIQGDIVDASIIQDERLGTADTYYLKPSEGWFALRNPELDLGIGMVWELSAFPFLWMWHSYCGNSGYPFYKRNYNIGIEPYSVPIQTLAESVRDGCASVLRANQSYETKLLVTFTQGKHKITHISEDGQVF